jgi:hypothetical protein
MGMKTGMKTGNRELSETVTLSFTVPGPLRHIFKAYDNKN